MTVVCFLALTNAMPPPPLTYDNTMVANNMGKKDVFMSRGWGAGGMPFSVLYMHPQQQHSPQVTQRPIASPQALALTGQEEDADYRQMALRNSHSPASRRHYSIIPQLFVSYGWGPIGK